MFSIPTRKTIEHLSAGEFVIRGALEPTEDYTQDHVDVVIESLGAEPNLLRAGALRFLDMHSYYCNHMTDPITMDSEDRIIPKVEGNAPRAFRVQIRLPLISRTRKKRQWKHPLVVLRIASGFLAESIQNVLDEKHFTLPDPDPRLRSFRTTL